MDTFSTHSSLDRSRLTVPVTSDEQLIDDAHGDIGIGHSSEPLPESTDTLSTSDNGPIIMPNQNGGRKLALDGYMYVVHSTLKEGAIRWRCVKCNKLKCYMAL
jgi:hypothetical protein